MQLKMCVCVFVGAGDTISTLGQSNKKAIGHTFGLPLIIFLANMTPNTSKLETDLA